MKDESSASIAAFWSEPPGPRVPRIALMGEFSAGKSTLANLMIGTSPLPVQVVATQLPPVWISHGSAPPVIVDLQGNETPCDLETLQGIAPKDTAFVKFYSEAEILTNCDIIDMPGISDPNMPSDVWERILPLADAVLWCTPATQAWRQSEAAVWEAVEDRIKQHSLLIVTRADMLVTERDRNKVFKRVKSETSALFADMVMMSLTKAQGVQDDEEMWADSGADAFVDTFLQQLDKVKSCLSEGLDLSANAIGPGTQQVTAEREEPVSQIVPRRPVVRKAVQRDAPEPESNASDPASYMPKFS
jgi:hypothetical protein